MTEFAQFLFALFWYAVFILVPGGAFSITLHFLLSLPMRRRDRALFFLDLIELYHIYGLTVALTLSLTLGSKLVLMPRFDVQKLCALLIQESVTMMPVVPPAINAMCQAVDRKSVV